MPKITKKTGAAILVLAGLALALGLADRLLAGPMRAWAERTMNARLDGYSVRIGRVHPHLWRLALSLEDLVLVQKNHPEPPVADIGELRFSMLWQELMQFKVAGNLVIVRPALHVNLAQIQVEVGRGRLQDRGWQSAVESVVPFRLNRVEVRDGSLLYLSGGTASKPLQFTRVAMVAQNVRNIRGTRGSYPSPVTLAGSLFDTGTIRFDGAADFLREPQAAAQGELRLGRVPLDRLDPLAKDYQLRTSGGLLSAHGHLEYTPEAKVAHLAEVLVEDLRVDFVTSAATRALELQHAQEAAAAVRRVRNQARLLLQVDSLRLTHSQIGFENQSANPPYRLFLSEVQLDLKNLTNQTTQGRSSFQAKGAFMGSGAATATGGFQPAARPDFAVQLRLDNANLPDINHFLRASTGVDVARGRLSVYSEVTVRNGHVEGYLKPLVQDLKIYDAAKDRGKPLGKRIEEHVLQGLASLFRNHTTHQVATVARISGATDDPRFSEWEAIRKLIRNGFIQAIRPGFLDGPGISRPGPSAPAPPARPARTAS